MIRPPKQPDGCPAAMSVRLAGRGSAHLRPAGGGGACVRPGSSGICGPIKILNVNSLSHSTCDQCNARLYLVKKYKKL